MSSPPSSDGSDKARSVGHAPAAADWRITFITGRATGTIQPRPLSRHLPEKQLSRGHTRVHPHDRHLAARRRQSPLQLLREQQVRLLGVRVDGLRRIRHRSRQVPGCHRGGELAAVRRDARDDDDSATGVDPGHEQRGQQCVPEVIRAHLHLEPVLCERERAGHHARVVDEREQRTFVCKALRGELSHTREVGEIEPAHNGSAGCAARRSRREGSRLAPGGVAAGHDHRRPVREEHPRSLEADARVGARDHDPPTFPVADFRRLPASHEASLSAGPAGVAGRADEPAATAGTGACSRPTRCSLRVSR